MPSFDEIVQYLVGAWRLMFGKADGVQQLDLSADGFWNSFFAMVVALPPLLLMWIGMANARLADGSYTGSRSGLIAIYGLVDFLAWVVPLAALILMAKFLGVADRVIAFVVSSNWASAIVVWLMLPIGVLSVVAPGTQAEDLLLFIAFVATSVMMWRLTNAVMGKGPGVASMVFGVIFVLSILTVTILSSAFGIVAAPQG